MTDHDWRTSADPHALLTFLLRHHKPTDRQLRLFACACCRRFWDQLAPANRQAIEAAEAFADGQLDYEPRLEAARAARDEPGLFNIAATWPAAQYGQIAAAQVIDILGQTVATSPDQIFDKSQWLAESRQQAHLLRDIFGQPGKNPRLDPCWLLWNGGTIVLLARTMYEERCFEAMPILGDALEEAGCNNAGLLEHCRNGRDHVRGCWVLDLILRPQPPLPPP